MGCSLHMANCDIHLFSVNGRQYKETTVYFHAMHGKKVRGRNMAKLRRVNCGNSTLL